MPNIRAVVFDMDGTLLDSRELIYRAFEHVLTNNNVPATRQQIAAVTGKPVHAMYSILAPQYDALELQRQHFDHHETNLELISAYDGVHELLTKIKASGLQCALFTGFDDTTYSRLTQVGLLDYFDSIVESTRYIQHKPHAEGLLLALQEMGITDPAQVVYVGDAPIDIEAGKNAGVFATIGVHHGFATKQQLLDAEATHVVGSILELDTLLTDRMYI